MTAEKLFKNPTAQYRGKPFWAWNGKLERGKLLRQIEIFQKMGMGGYFCHSRVGLVTDYLGDEWFAHIRAASEHGEKLGLESWLYDEDRWPSGTAGGMVTKDPALRMKFIRLEILPRADFIDTEDMIAAFTADVNGYSFTNKRRIASGETAKGCTVLKFTAEEMAENPVYNGQTYADTMNPAATARFIELTHEQYRRHCGDLFGGAIRGIFTDEPHRGAVMCGFSVDNRDPAFLTPATDSLFDEFKAAFGYELIEFLPELFLQKDGEPVSPVKWQYIELLQRLFHQHFLTPIQNWCKENNLLLTGHLLHEDSLSAQTAMIGSVMRCYEYMDVPGVDVLNEHNMNFWIVKQLQSAARQLGKQTLLTELYGCTGWEMNFESHKAVGDWQALFGANLRCHHLCWYTMEGAAKRDYPASIFHQSAWFEQYKYIEDYFSRLNVFTSQGKPLCDVLVLNPVESLWAMIRPGWADNEFSPADKAVQSLEQRYVDVFGLLCGGKLDFDYGDEDFLARMGKVVTSDGGVFLHVGKMRYKSVLVTGAVTIRGTTLTLLERFIKKGGNVVFAGEPPAYVDAVPSERARNTGGSYTAFHKTDILNHLTAKPMIKITDKNGQTIEDVYAQIRTDDVRTYFLLMNINRKERYEQVRVELDAGGFCTFWNARNGQINLLAQGDKISFTKTFEPLEELPLAVSAQNVSALPPVCPGEAVRRIPCGDLFDYSLSEPNVCVLDQVSYQLNGGAWREPLEILKADHVIRDTLGIPRRGFETYQPWLIKQNRCPPLGALALRYRFWVREMPERLTLAMESPECFTVEINGKNALMPYDGRWIDSCFHFFEIDMTAVLPGENSITLRCAFREDIDLEAIYLLGGFGVVLDGVHPALTRRPDQLRQGDITAQGFPFYGAGLVYYTDLPEVSDGEQLILKTDGFDAACINIDGHAIISAKPYEANVTALAGTRAGIEYILTRRNTFGPLHLSPAKAETYPPFSFDSEGIKFEEKKFTLLPQGMTHPIYMQIIK